MFLDVRPGSQVGVSVPHLPGGVKRGPARRWLNISHRTTLAATARLSESLRPTIGIRTAYLNTENLRYLRYLCIAHAGQEPSAIPFRCRERSLEVVVQPHGRAGQQLAERGIARFVVYGQAV